MGLLTFDPENSLDSDPSVGQMALRWPLEGHFELFWALVAKWLSDGLWRVILSSSGPWWPNGSRMASGASF